MSDFDQEPSSDNGSDADTDQETPRYYACVGFTIQVNTLIGTSFSVAIFLIDTVRGVKQRIGMQESLNPAHQHLVFGSRELENHETVGDIGLVQGSKLTLIMTLKGGPAPVSTGERNSLLVAARRAQVGRSTLLRPEEAPRVVARSGPRSSAEEYLEIVLVKCDGSVHVYYIPASDGSLEVGTQAPNRRGAHEWTEVFSSDYSEDESSDSGLSDDQETPRPQLTQQVAVDNCKTRTRMMALQRKMTRKRQKRRKRLMKESCASPASARRRVPSPRNKPDSLLPSNDRAHQYPKSGAYVKAIQRLNVLRAEMYLQSTQYKKVYGWSPYTMAQLDEYVTAKLHVLNEDEGYARPTMVLQRSRANPLTPTVLLRDPYTSSCDTGATTNAGETESNRSRVHTARDIAATRPLDTRPQVETPRTPRAHRNGKNKTWMADPRPPTCNNLPFSYDHNFDEIVQTPRKHVEKLSRDSVAAASSAAAAEKKADLQVIKSLTHAFSRAGVKSARLKYKSKTRASASGSGGGGGGASTRGQEPLVDLMTEQEQESEPNGSEASANETAGAGTPQTVQQVPKTSSAAATVPSASTSTPSPSATELRKTKSKTTTDAKGTPGDSKRCGKCKKRLSIVNEYPCRCGQYFCSNHRYAEAHNCSFDYKKEGRRIIEKANPVITSAKLPDI